MSIVVAIVECPSISPTTLGLTPKLIIRVACPPKTGPGVKLDLGWMKGGEMPMKKHTPEQVTHKLREAEVALA